MQNSIIKYELTDNTVDSFVLINPTKQQIFFIAKEESQMFPSSDYNYSGTVPSGFTNDPNWQSENRDSLIGYVAAEVAAASSPQAAAVSLSNFNASFMPVDYIGLSKVIVPAQLNQSYTSVSLFNPITNALTPFYTTTSGNIQNVMSGIQTLKIPANVFNTTLTDPTAIAANGGSTLLENFQTYFLIISPMYVQSSIVQVAPRAEFEFALTYLNESVSGGINLPNTKRRWIYSCANSDFLGTVWNFESQPTQVGRLLGSVVEIWDSSLTTLKQTKVMNENSFNFSTGTLTEFVISPDNVGYDTVTNQISPGDILRIYPRETYFDQFTIDVNYTDSTKSLKAAFEFMLNDVARDMTTGIYEVYDENGFTIDSSGNFNGNVVLAYQISQYGNYEIRQQIKQ